MRRMSRALWALLPSLLLAASLPAQDEPDDAAARTQMLLDLLKGLEETHQPNPSVLAEVDLKRAGPETLKIARTLRQTRLDLVLEDQDLPGALDLLHELSGLNFLITPKAKAALEAEKPKLNMTLRGLTLENILNLLALHLEDYRFAIRYGAVVLMAKEEYRPPKVTRIYPVADLVRPLPDFPAPRLALGSLDEKK